MCEWEGTRLEADVPPLGLKQTDVEGQVERQNEWPCGGLGEVWEREEAFIWM